MDCAKVIASSGGTYTYRVCLSTKNPIIHSVSPKGWGAGRTLLKNISSAKDLSVCIDSTTIDCHIY